MLEAAKIVPLVDTLCFDLDALTEVEFAMVEGTVVFVSSVLASGNVWLFIGAREAGATLCG